MNPPDYKALLAEAVAYADVRGVAQLLTHFSNDDPYIKDLHTAAIHYALALEDAGGKRDDRYRVLQVLNRTLEKAVQHPRA